MASVEIESRDLRQLSRDLRNADRKLEKAMKREMAAVAEPIRRRIVTEASWSSRIPAATKASTRFTAKTQNVIVTVNRKQAPHARPIENDGRAGTFEHPLFGKVSRFRKRPIMVRQQARPFFAKAIKASEHRIDAAIVEIADRYANDLGFK